MKLSDILKTVGSVALREAVPGGGIILGLVNEVLPAVSKLGQDATGADVEAAVESLPDEVRTKLINKEFDIKRTEIKEGHETLRAIIEADIKNQQSTRPYIAKGAFFVVAFTIITVVSVWVFGVLAGKIAVVVTVGNSWQFILALIGPLVTLLWAYFGVLKTEHKNRMTTASGNSPAAGIVGALAGLLKK